jgi:O-acetyl-ADP-ribose deacetylase (regulator of RNase III)
MEKRTMPKWLQSIIDASLDKLLLIAGFVFTVLAFDPVRYSNKAWDFSLKPSPNLFLFVPGSVLLGFFLWWKHREQHFYGASAKKIEGGYQLQFRSDHSISVATGKIEDFAGGEHAAVVLPANTSFDDQCIRDSRTALGSFFLKHFPNGIAEIQDLIRAAAKEVTGKTKKTFCAASPGTAILLDKPLGSALRIIVTPVTTADPEHGISADTVSLISAVKQVFKLACQNRISSLTLPVMGTGHGGLDFKAALSLLLVQCVNSIEHEGAHHVREVKIIVFDPEKKLKDVVSKVVDSVRVFSQI